MWPDNETTNDLIGFKVHADLIRSVVTNHAMLPTTIGVFGDWGGGKTSIMKMLERDLNPETWPEDSQFRKQYENIAVVYVNTWLFEGYDDAKAAILSSILLELAEHKRFGPKVRDAVTSLLKSVNWMRFTRMAVQHVAIPAAAAFFTGGIAAVPAAVALSTGLSSVIPSSDVSSGKKDGAGEDKVSWQDLLKNETSDTQAMDVRTFRQRFQKMLTDGGITTLVVLIDDLDRCTPDRIIENLEAVKLFLSAEGSAFVIGADRRIVEHAIRARYAEQASGSDEETQRLVKDYLEKLVQVPYSLPRLSTSEIETYITLLFCQRYLGTEELALCSKACDEGRSRNRYGSFGYAGVRAAVGGNELEPELTASLTFVATSAPLIADGLKGNPRQVKRFLNAFLLRKELARIAKLDNIRDNVLVKLMILEYSNLELFSQLFTWQSHQDGHPRQIADLEAVLTGPKGNVNDEESAKKVDPRWATTAVRRWLAMEPLMKDVDLRDYFWVARDRLESTFAGISMVSPVVRTIVDGLLSGLAPKRNAAMDLAQKLTEDERTSLLSLISQHVVREPENKDGYDAIRFLIEAGVAGAAELLVKTIIDRPLANMPPAIGMDFMTLYKAKPGLHAILNPAKDHLLRSSTRVGKAAQAANQGKK